MDPNFDEDYIEWTAEPPVDWEEIDSIEAQEAREESENGDA